MGFGLPNRTARTDLVPEEAAANIDLLASNNDDLLAVKSLLGDCGRQTTQEMALAVDDNGRRGERGHFRGLIRYRRSIRDCPRRVEGEGRRTERGYGGESSVVSKQIETRTCLVYT